MRSAHLADQEKFYFFKLCQLNISTLPLESWQREAIVHEEATFIFQRFFFSPPVRSNLSLSLGAHLTAPNGVTLLPPPPYNYTGPVHTPFSSLSLRALPHTSLPPYKCYKLGTYYYFTSHKSPVRWRPFLLDR